MNVYVNYKIKHRNTNPKDRTNEKIFDGFNSFNSKGRTQAHAYSASRQKVQNRCGGSLLKKPTCSLWVWPHSIRAKNFNLSSRNFVLKLVPQHSLYPKGKVQLGMGSIAGTQHASGRFFLLKKINRLKKESRKEHNHVFTLRLTVTKVITKF